MKELLYKSGIIVHVLAGVLALTTGLIAMTTRKKGGKLHNQTGSLFYWSMAVIFITTLLFFMLYPAKIIYHFFLMIGIISFYPTYSGRRILQMKKGINPRLSDRVAAVLITVSGLVSVGYGIYLQQINPQPLSVLFLVFGSFSILQGYQDLKLFTGKQEIGKMHWFYSHAAKMIGAYSAAVTAFCVNIIPRYLPETTPQTYLIVLWIAPGLLFSFISARVIGKYKRKFELVPAAKNTTDKSKSYALRRLFYRN
jgi:uncharacterized membrane protein